MGNHTKQRILSLDGGGTWAIVQVEALAQLYSSETRGHDILRDFDHAVANSAGSIVLAGLLLNAKLGEIRANFCDLAARQALFTPIGAWQGGMLYKVLRTLTGGPKYSTARKREALSAIFDGYARANGIPSLALADLAARVGPDFQFTIVGYDYRRDRAKYFRSRTQSRAASIGGVAPSVRLTDAVHASSTAPVQYFDRAADSAPLHGELFWDGAVTGQNNPIVSGVIEALANGAERDQIVVLSIGTGGVTLPPALVQGAPWQTDSHFQRAAGDMKKVSKSIISDPPDHASFVAHMMLTTRLPENGDARNQSPVVRMSPLIAPQPSPDGGATWPWPAGLQTPAQRRVIDIDMDAVSNPDFGLVRQMADDWINGKIRNQPIRMGSDLVCDLGDETFAAAVARWKALA